LQAGFGPSRTAFNDLESEIPAANVNRLVPAWTGSLGGQSAAEPLVDAGSAYARSDGRLSSFNLETGATRWSVAVGSAGDLAGGSAAVPVLANGSLWVPTTGRTACALVRINPADGTTISTLTHNVVPPDIEQSGPGVGAVPAVRRLSPAALTHAVPASERER
jgi:outer membrane protein assembly factor BamB